MTSQASLARALPIANLHYIRIFSPPHSSATPWSGTQSVLPLPFAAHSISKLPTVPCLDQPRTASRSILERDGYQTGSNFRTSLLPSSPVSHLQSPVKPSLSTSCVLKLEYNAATAKRITVEDIISLGKVRLSNPSRCTHTLHGQVVRDAHPASTTKRPEPFLLLCAAFSPAEPALWLPRLTFREYRLVSMQTLRERVHLYPARNVPVPAQ